MVALRVAEVSQTRLFVVRRRRPKARGWKERQRFWLESEKKGLSHQPNTNFATLQQKRRQEPVKIFCRKQLHIYFSVWFIEA